MSTTAHEVDELMHANGWILQAMSGRRKGQHETSQVAYRRGAYILRFHYVEQTLARVELVTGDRTIGLVLDQDLAGILGV